MLLGAEQRWKTPERLLEEVEARTRTVVLLPGKREEHERRRLFAVHMAVHIWC